MLGMGICNKTTSQADNREQICFTGFRPADKRDSQSKADAAGMKVVKPVSKKSTYLCIGPNAGPKKMEKAKDQGVTLLTADQFESLITTGELA